MHGVKRPICNCRGRRRIVGIQAFRRAEHYKYNDVRINLLALPLLQVMREPLSQVLKRRLMDPIGASPTWRWYAYDNSWVERDGLHMQSVPGGGHFGGGMVINALDHARFGLLVEREAAKTGVRLERPASVN